MYMCPAQPPLPWGFGINRTVAKLGKTVDKRANKETFLCTEHQNNHLQGLQVPVYMNFWEMIRYDNQYPEYYRLVQTDKNRWEYQQVVDKQLTEHTIQLHTQHEALRYHFNLIYKIWNKTKFSATKTA